MTEKILTREDLKQMEADATEGLREAGVVGTPAAAPPLGIRGTPPPLGIRTRPRPKVKTSGEGAA